MAAPERRPLVAGNWKMNGLKASAAELAKIVAGAKFEGRATLIVCPPATLVADDTLLVNPAWVDPSAFGDVERVEVDPSEPGAANALLVERGLPRRGES